MPYKLRKAPKRNLYWVVTIETGKKHSKDPIPLAKAQAQMRILEQQLVGGTIPKNVAQQFIDILEETPRRPNLENDLRVVYNALPLEDRHKVDLMIQNKSSNEFEYLGALLLAGILPEDVKKIRDWFYEDCETDEEGAGKGKKLKLKGGLSPAHLNLIYDSLLDTMTMRDAREAVRTVLELLTPNQREVLRKTFIQFDVLHIDVLKALEILEIDRPATQEELASYNTELRKTITAMKEALNLYLPVIGIRNGAGKPSNDIFQKIAVESYAKEPKKNVDGWELVSFTPTLKFYRKGSDIVVGVRGTADARDTSADLSLAYNGLTSTDRFKEDVGVLKQFQNQYPDIEYYGVGHSLGGAVLDELIKLNLIKSGISYNPAVQPQNFRADIPNHRIYEEGDALYALSGMFLKNKPEVRKKPFSVVGYLKKKVTPAPVGYLASHGLDNFKGGRYYKSKMKGRGYAKGKASVFVLTCIDPRYNYDVTHFLEKQKSLHKDYDLFVLAGASVGAEKKEWTKTFFDNLALGIQLHGIKEVWCFDHLDCGMYKAVFGLEKDDKPELHIQCMDKLKKLIAKKHPSLGFRKFLVSADGKVGAI